MDWFTTILVVIGAMTVSVNIMRFVDFLEKGGRRRK